MNIVKDYLIFYACVSPIVAVSAQKKTETDVYADVPADKRARFIERLNTFFQYYRERDKGKVYDMLGEQAKQYVVGGLSREIFLKEVYLLKLKKFKVEEVGEWRTEQGKETGIWSIYGCGEYSRLGPNEKLRSSLEAYWQDGDWYFSQIGTPHPLHGEPEGCR